MENVIFEDSRIGRAGYALKLDSPFGQAGYARNVTWRNITIDEAEQALYINAAAYTAKPNTPPSKPQGCSRTWSRCSDNLRADL